MENEILSIETAKRIADLERDVSYYKEIRNEAIANNVKLREEKLLLEKRIKDLKVKLNCKEYFSSTMPENTEFVILTKENYDRQQKDIELELIDYKSRNEKYEKVINEIKEKIDDYFGYDYENESQARLDTINEINHIIVDLYNGGDEE